MPNTSHKISFSILSKIRHGVKVIKFPHAGRIDPPVRQRIVLCSEKKKCDAYTKNSAV